jgi:hypothetical protein
VEWKSHCYLSSQPANLTCLNRTTVEWKLRTGIDLRDALTGLNRTTVEWKYSRSGRRPQSRDWSQSNHCGMEINKFLPSVAAVGICLNRTTVEWKYRAGGKSSINPTPSQSNHCGMEIRCSSGKGPQRTLSNSLNRTIVEWKCELLTSPRGPEGFHPSQSNHSGMEIAFLVDERGEWNGNLPSPQMGARKVSIEPLWNGNHIPSPSGQALWRKCQSNHSGMEIIAGNRSPKSEARAQCSIVYCDAESEKILERKIKKKYLQKYFLFCIIDDEKGLNRTIVEWKSNRTTSRFLIHRVSIEPLWNGNYSRERKPEVRSPGSIAR